MREAWFSLKFNVSHVLLLLRNTTNNNIRFFDQSLCVRGKGCSKSMKSMIHRQACILYTNIGKINVKCVGGGRWEEGRESMEGWS
jgi:hypothetical protein